MQKGKNSVIRQIKFNDASAGYVREIKVQLNNRMCIIDFDVRVGLLFDMFQGRNWSETTKQEIVNYLEGYFDPQTVE